MTSTRSNIVVAAVAGLLGAVAGGFGVSFLGDDGQPQPRLDAEYYEVLLVNGEMYYGRLENLASPCPVLTDVFYPQRRRDAQNQNTELVLIKLGAEWHGPDQLIINANQIVLIEPVGPQSDVAKFIADFKRR